MSHCIVCGRWLMDTWTYKCSPEDGIMLEEGPVCGCCILKEGKRLDMEIIKQLERLLHE